MEVAVANAKVIGENDLMKRDGEIIQKSSWAVVVNRLFWKESISRVRRPKAAFTFTADVAKLTENIQNRLVKFFYLTKRRFLSAKFKAQLLRRDFASIKWRYEITNYFLSAAGTVWKGDISAGFSICERISGFSWGLLIPWLNHLLKQGCKSPHPNHPTSVPPRHFRAPKYHPPLNSGWFSNHPTPPHKNWGGFKTNPPHPEKFGVVSKPTHPSPKNLRWFQNYPTPP